MYVVTPDGKRLRSNLEIEKYLQLHPEVAYDKEVTKTSPWPEDIFNIYMKSYVDPQKKTEKNQIPIKDSEEQSTKEVEQLQDNEN